VILSVPDIDELHASLRPKQVTICRFASVTADMVPEADRFADINRSLDFARHRVQSFGIGAR
jgi:hypothetical protein